MHNDVNHICKCKDCGYEEQVWYDDEDYGYRPVCTTEGCPNEGNQIFDEDSIDFEFSLELNKHKKIQHQEFANENYFEEMNDYLDGSMNI